ncbi:MAG: hypothetical protein IKS59_03360, partial [Aeriscardovia sp.]|nr:hypothetical protein [Aeriscardovia sp.]
RAERGTSEQRATSERATSEHIYICKIVRVVFLWVSHLCALLRLTCFFPLSTKRRGADFLLCVHIRERAQQKKAFL